jgi:hypothetical protein
MSVLGSLSLRVVVFCYDALQDLPTRYWLHDDVDVRLGLVVPIYDYAVGVLDVAHQRDFLFEYLRLVTHPRVVLGKNFYCCGTSIPSVLREFYIANSVLVIDQSLRMPLCVTDIIKWKVLLTD